MNNKDTPNDADILAKWEHKDNVRDRAAEQNRRADSVVGGGDKVENYPNQKVFDLKNGIDDIYGEELLRTTLALYQITQEDSAADIASKFKKGGSRFFSSSLDKDKTTSLVADNREKERRVRVRVELPDLSPDKQSIRLRVRLVYGKVESRVVYQGGKEDFANYLQGDTV